MSFDLSFLAPVGTTVPVQAVAEWLAADERIDELSGRPDSFEALTAIGGDPWAAFIVEDVSDLDPDDLTIESAPDDLAMSGVWLEISYSTPEPIVHEVFELAEAFAQHVGLVVVDEQADDVEPVEMDQLRASWSEASALARAAFEQHLRNQPG